MSGIHFSSPLHAAASAVGALPDDAAHRGGRGSRATPTVSVLLSGGFHAVALALFLLMTARSRDEGIRLILKPTIFTPPITFRSVPPPVTHGGPSSGPNTGGVVDPVPPTFAPPDVGDTDFGPVKPGDVGTDPRHDTGDTGNPPPAPPTETTNQTTIQPYDEPPVPTYSPEPPYPEIARSAGIEGLVRLEAIVSHEGRVLSVEVRDGNVILADAAKRTVLTWKFQPGKRKGVPVTTRVAIPVRFTLRD